MLNDITALIFSLMPRKSPSPLSMALDLFVLTTAYPTGLLTACLVCSACPRFIIWDRPPLIFINRQHPGGSVQWWLNHQGMLHFLHFKFPSWGLRRQSWNTSVCTSKRTLAPEGPKCS